MAGYVPREREPLTREQKVAMVAAVIASAFLFVAAISATRWATPWLEKLNFGILPLGILEIVLGLTYLVPQKGEAAERPLALAFGSRRVAAGMSFVIGALIILVWALGSGGGR